MFGRGNWSVFGIEPESLDDFKKSLGDNLKALKASQIMAGKAIRFHGEATLGVNPYGNPRLDEEAELGNPAVVVCSQWADVLVNPDAAVDWDELRQWIPNEASLDLGNKAYGFWAVLNDPKDVTDPNSKKESLAYSKMGRPFKFLAKKEKEVVEQEVISKAVFARKQFAVLLDFQHGRAYAETTGKDDILALRDLLTDLGVKTFSLLWRFGEGSWVAKLLTKISSETRYRSDFSSRAQELVRFRPDEIAKLEDKVLEGIVSSYFAFTPLENGLVAALGCPSQVQIHLPSPPVGVTNPSVAFSLLGMTDDAVVAEASMTIVEPVIKRSKKGEEKTVNKPILSVSVGENINNYDAGAAMLKGLDLPQFKRHCKSAAKAQGGLEIKDYWSLWLSGLHDATLTITDCILASLNYLGGRTPKSGYDNCNYGLVVYESGADEDASEESEIKIDPKILTQYESVVGMQDKKSGEFKVQDLGEISEEFTDYARIEELPDHEGPGVSIIEVPDENPCKEIKIETGG